MESFIGRPIAIHFWFIENFASLFSSLLVTFSRTLSTFVQAFFLNQFQFFLSFSSFHFLYPLWALFTVKSELIYFWFVYFWLPRLAVVGEQSLDVRRMKKNVDLENVLRLKRRSLLCDQVATILSPMFVHGSIVVFIFFNSRNSYDDAKSRLSK